MFVTAAMTGGRSVPNFLGFRCRLLRAFLGAVFMTLSLQDRYLSKT
jgi:hypothetical protein